MDILYLLIPIAIIFVACALWAFFWSVNSGQYDDLESPAHSILFDDDEELIPDDAKQAARDAKVKHDSQQDG
ncbi:MAG: cbb3-type cytochrome oxidase assembly protein CcoS [Oceanospirillaceae bacterium]|nr:cbb3-type cytochrome oxidase assembly protein CcoS [Oceanospirillaceae bacterium]